MSTLTSRLKSRSLAFALVLCATLPLCALPPMQVDHAQRTLTGTVTDPHHEPLRGAVVKLQTGESSAITTYITGLDGHYIFKRLDGNTDYKVWVTFRERTTKSREISKFNSNMDTVIDFTLEPF